MSKYIPNVLLFSIGMIVGILFTSNFQLRREGPFIEKRTVPSELSQVVSEVANLTKDSGAKVTITRTTTEGKKETDSSASSSVGQSDNHFFRLLGPDRGANDAGSGIQPLTTDGTSIGGSRNWGILERFWNWFINWLWFIKWILILGMGGLIVMLFIPATSSMAMTIIQGIFSFLPVLGAAIVKLISNLNLKKITLSTEQIIDGTEIAKSKISREPFILSSDLVTVAGEDLAVKASNLTARVRDRAIALIKEAHNEAQDKSTREYVSTIKGD